MSGTRLELSPSWILAAAIVALHAAAAASVAAVLPGAAGMALAAAFLALGLAAAWSRALLGSAASARVLELSELQGIVEFRNGERLEAEAPGRGHVSRFLVVLALRRPARRSLLVSRDMLGRESFRRLRLWALWGRLPARLQA